MWEFALLPPSASYGSYGALKARISCYLISQLSQVLEHPERQPCSGGLEFLSNACQPQACALRRGLLQPQAFHWSGVRLQIFFRAAHCSASKFSNAHDGLVVLSLLHKPLCFSLLWTARSNSSSLWAVVLINIQSLLYTGKPAQQNHHLWRRKERQMLHAPWALPRARFRSCCCSIMMWFSTPLKIAHEVFIAQHLTSNTSSK